MKNELSYTLIYTKGNILSRKILSFCLLLVISSLSMIWYLHKTEYNRMQGNIASEILRFHVVANSDSPVDQALKLIIKNRIIDALAPTMKEVTSLEEARHLLHNNLDYLESLTDDIIKEHGFDYSTHVTIEKGYFPLKVYGDLTLPPGEYEAIRIELGQSKGQNWWCIMFPPLCFVDATYSIVPESSKEQLQSILTKEEYEILLSNKDIKVKAKFKLFDWLEKLIAGNESLLQ